MNSSASYGWNNIQKPIFSQFLNFEEDQDLWQQNMTTHVILKDRLGGNRKKTETQNTDWDLLKKNI